MSQVYRTITGFARAWPAMFARLEGAKRPNVDFGAELSVPHRLAIIYLMLPVVIWLVGWHQWWLGVPATLLVTIALSSVLSGSWKISFRPLTILLLVMALAWVMVTAAGGVFDAHNSDWDKLRAILLELARGDWPVRLPVWVSDLAVYFPGEVELTGYLLRYYLGYYMVPGLVGKWFGVAALNWAVALWTWCGVGLILLLFTRGYVGWKAIAAAAIFVFFSGMDVARTIPAEGWEWFKVWDWIHLTMEPGRWPTIELDRYHLEWAAPPRIWIHYFSNMYGLAWVPQHFIAAGLYALLLVQLRRHERFLAVSGIVVAGSLFWSPFVAIGVLPLVVVLFFENGVRPFLRWQNLLVPLPLAGILIGYLTSGFSNPPQGWAWEFIGSDILLRAMPVLFLTEFLVLVVLLVMLRPRLMREWFFVVSVGMLLLLPWYAYGELNDLVMRGLMPAVVLLSYYCAQTVLGGLKEAWSYARLVLTGLVVVVLGVGVVTVMFELVRANNDHEFGVFRYERLERDYSVLRDISPQYQNQYVAHELAGWYGGLLGEGGSGMKRLEGKGELILQREYAVYLNEHLLIYVKEECDEAEQGAQFFIEALPIDEGTLPGNQAHYSFNFEFKGHGWRAGETCVAVRELPWWYRVGHIKTGQYNAERTGHRWLGHYYSAEYRDWLLREAGEPVIRSQFEVYLQEKKVIYSKGECSEGDVEAPFKLEVIPVDVKDLPEGRRGEGKEEIEFMFSDYGGWLGESCLVIQELPGYRVKSIKTGQYKAGGGHVWEGSYTFEE